MEQHHAQAYMVNTGWNGSGKRISIKDTRAIIDRILDGSIDQAEMHILPVFNFQIPAELAEVSNGILDPRKTYDDPQVWDQKAKELGGLFVKNFQQYTDTPEGHRLLEAGPHL